MLKLTKHDGNGSLVILDYQDIESFEGDRTGHGRFTIIQMWTGRVHRVKDSLQDIEEVLLKLTGKSWKE